MRPIDADVLKVLMMADSLQMMLFGKKYELSDAMKTVNNAPTIDAVQVIRCKDCKYYHSKSYGHYCENDIYVATGEEFCSRAERRGQYDTVD